MKTIITNSRGTRSLEVSYEIGGPGTTYKGLDGDEFRSSVRWDGSALFFDTIEHEGESDIPQKGDLDSLPGPQYLTGREAIDKVPEEQLLR